MGDSQGQRHRSRPAPGRAGPAWPQFLRSQAGAILASDFFTADLPDGTQPCVLAVIEHATRRIRIPAVTPHPTGQWTTQQARNLLMDPGEQADRVKFMIRDRGSNFTAAFDASGEATDLSVLLTTIDEFVRSESAAGSLAAFLASRGAQFPGHEASILTDELSFTALSFRSLLAASDGDNPDQETS